MNDQLQKLSVYATDLITSIETQQMELEAEKLAVQRISENNLIQSKDIVSRQKNLNLMAESVKIEKEATEQKMKEAIKIRELAEKKQKETETAAFDLKGRTELVSAAETKAARIVLKEGDLIERENELKIEQAVLERQKELLRDKQEKLAVKEQTLEQRDARARKLHDGT